MKPLRWRRLGLVGAAALIATAGLTLVAEPALAVPGRVVVTATTVTDSISPKSGLAACPAGTVPLGGGGAVKSAVAGLTIVQDNPTATGWIFAAIEQGAGTNSNWSLTTWAVCAPAPAGYQVITASGTITPPAPANASCPAGKKVTGGGAVLDTPVGDNVRVIESIRPNSTLSTVSVSAKLDPGALSGPASNAFTSFAVCINQLAGQQTRDGQLGHRLGGQDGQRHLPVPDRAVRRRGHHPQRRRPGEPDHAAVRRQPGPGRRARACRWLCRGLDAAGVRHLPTLIR